MPGPEAGQYAPKQAAEEVVIRIRACLQHAVTASPSVRL